MTKRTCLVHEASERSGLHPNTIRTYCNKKVIFSFRDKNGFRRIPEEEVKRLELIANGLLRPEQE